MNFNSLREKCHFIRILAGAVLITLGFVSGNPWFFLGVLPAIAGAKNFCPICTVTNKCSIHA